MTHDELWTTPLTPLEHWTPMHPFAWIDSNVLSLACVYFPSSDVDFSSRSLQFLSIYIRRFTPRKSAPLTQKWPRPAH